MAFTIPQPGDTHDVAYALAVVPSCETQVVAEASAQAYANTTKEHGEVDGFGFQCVPVDVKRAFGA